MHRPAALAAAFLLAAAAGAQPVELVSVVDPSLVPDTAGGTFVATEPVSADGRYVAFASQAPHLVPGVDDGNATWDVFLHDRVLGTTTLVSHAAADAGRAGDGLSHAPKMSADGRYVAYVSEAGNLVTGQVGGGLVQVFLWDRLSGATTLVSHAAGAAATAGNGPALVDAISGDGGVVVYSSSATNLVAGQVDANGTHDVFRFSRATGTSALVSHAAGAPTTAAGDVSLQGTINGAGTAIAFLSRATNLVAGQVDANGAPDVFLHDATTGENLLASRAAGTTATTANGSSFEPRVSRQGNQVIFTSHATNVVDGQLDANGTTDVFQFRRFNTPLLVSRAAGTETTTPAGASRGGVPSWDGARVAFVSHATDVVRGQVDANGAPDVFVFERATGGKTLVSHRDGDTATTADAGSDEPRLSDDGARVAFGSRAGDLVAGQATATGPGSSDVFLWESGEATRLVSHTPADDATGVGGAVETVGLARDGGVVVYTSAKAGLDAALDTNGVDDTFAWDAATGDNELLSRRDPARPSATAGDSWVDREGMASADGRFVVFESESVALVPGQVDRAGTGDVFLRDRLLGTTTLVSHRAGAPATAADSGSWTARVSADGAWVAFASIATDLVAGQVDTPETVDVFLWSRATGAVTLVSHADGAPATAVATHSDSPALDAAGRHVAYLSFGAEDADAYRFDRVTGETRLVSHRDGQPTAPGGAAGPLSISADGAWVAFASAGEDLAAGQVDANGTFDVFLWPADTGATVLVSHAAGAPGVAASGASTEPRVSADGRHVAYQSRATDLVAGQADANGGRDVFLWRRTSDTATLVSHAAGTPAVAGDDDSFGAVVAADGSFVAFQSRATDLVAGQVDAPGTNDVFLHDATAGTTRLVSRAAGDPLRAVGDSTTPQLSDDGAVVAFLSGATDLVPRQVDGAGDRDVFVYRRDEDRVELASRRAGTAARGADAGIHDLDVSGDGATVVFFGEATDLVPADRNGLGDVFAFTLPPSTIFADGFESGTTSAWSAP